MKSYHVEYDKAAQKAIDKLDNSVRKRILTYINNNLEGCENPRWKGKNLVNHPEGNWQYRVDDYRIIADIQDEKIVIIIIDVDKRNDVYKK